MESLGVDYRHVGRLVDAAGPGKEAVELLRTLSAQSSAYTPELASSLNNLAIHYAGTSGPTDAIEPAETSVGLYRELAMENPAFLPDLAKSLNNLGNHYAEAGRHAEAVQTSGAAVALRKSWPPITLVDGARKLDSFGGQVLVMVATLAGLWRLAVR